jgi:hypothetical protein
MRSKGSGWVSWARQALGWGGEGKCRLNSYDDVCILASSTLLPPSLHCRLTCQCSQRAFACMQVQAAEGADENSFSQPAAPQCTPPGQLLGLATQLQRVSWLGYWPAAMAPHGTLFPVTHASRGLLVIASTLALQSSPCAGAGCPSWSLPPGPYTAAAAAHPTASRVRSAPRSWRPAWHGHAAKLSSRSHAMLLRMPAMVPVLSCPARRTRPRPHGHPWS